MDSATPWPHMGPYQPLHGGPPTATPRVNPPVPAPPADRPVRTSLVMVVFHTGEPLAQSLAHVLDEPAVDEFIVVDNGSSPEEAGVLEQAAARDGRLKLLTGHGNIGFARAANLGARTARGEVVVFLNPDAYLQPRCVPALLEALEGAPAPAVAGAHVLNRDGTEQRGGRRGEVTPVSTILSFSHLSLAAPGLRRFEIHREVVEPLPKTVVATPTISGACFAMRREDFDAVNGFDQGYFLHVEDVDLCWRVRGAGGVVLFQPAAKVVHLGHSSIIHPLFVEFWKGVGLARYFRKRADLPRRKALAYLLSPLVILVSVLRPLIWKLSGRPI